ncbi:MAG: hypothetical protein K2M91_03920 [Lachnospiraceae bacterium]|nr:hypothetical protein [Lachnospiraceae bacterium]
MKNSKLKKMIGVITHNFGLKILAVLISCGLWFVVNSITDPLQTKTFYNIPVEIINADVVTNEGKVYEVLDGTNSVNITVIGKRKIVDDLAREDMKAVADMSELTIMNTIGIKPSSARNNSELDFRTNIDNVKLSIEQRKSVNRPINVSTTGDPAAGYVVGEVNPSQNIVRLSGPESLVVQIDHIGAVVDIEGCSSDINTSVELKLYDAENNEIKNSSIKMNITTVNVDVVINATKEVPLSFVVPDEPAPGYVVSKEMLSVPERILIAGRSSVLDGISKIVVSDPALSVESRTENMTTIVNIKKYLPAGVEFADSSFNGNVSVTVGIERLVTKDLRIPARNFAAGNKPDNLSLTLGEVENQEYFTIRISGTQAAVDIVNEENVIGVVDMNALLEKAELTEWVAGIYQGEITFNLPDNVTLAQPYLMTVILEEIEADSDDEEIAGNNDDNNE